MMFKWMEYPSTREAGAECDRCGKRLVVWDVDHVPQEFVDEVMFDQSLYNALRHSRECEATDD